MKLQIYLTDERRTIKHEACASLAASKRKPQFVVMIYASLRISAVIFLVCKGACTLYNGQLANVRGALCA